MSKKRKIKDVDDKICESLDPRKTKNDFRF